MHQLAVEENRTEKAHPLTDFMAFPTKDLFSWNDYLKNADISILASS